MPDESHESSTSLARRWKLVLWQQHQPFIALMLVGCAIGMSLYFADQARVNRGLVDIDAAPAVDVEYRIDINQANWYEIVVLPSVGEKLARAIVEFRESKGPFQSIDAIQSVPGIGEKKLAQLRPYLLPIDN